MTDATMNLFVCQDTLRPALLQPWTWNGYTGATDGQALILVPGEDVRYKPFDGERDIAEILPLKTPHGITVSVEAVRGALDAIQMIPEMVDETCTCEECDGTGVVECPHCEQEMECEDCNGAGQTITKTKPTGKMIQNDGAFYKINGVPFRQGLIRRLLAVADELGVGTFDHVSIPNMVGANEFTVGHTRVILMPVRI